MHTVSKARRSSSILARCCGLLLVVAGEAVRGFRPVRLIHPFDGGFPCQSLFHKSTHFDFFQVGVVRVSSNP